MARSIVCMFTLESENFKAMEEDLVPTLSFPVLFLAAPEVKAGRL